MFELKVVKENDKDVLRNLLEYYLYDFNFYYEDDLNENGRFEFIDVEPYINDNRFYVHGGIFDCSAHFNCLQPNSRYALINTACYWRGYRPLHVTCYSVSCDEHIYK